MSSAIKVCDKCALCLFVHLGATDVYDDCVSVWSPFARYG